MKKTFCVRKSESDAFIHCFVIRVDENKEDEEMLQGVTDKLEEIEKNLGGKMDDLGSKFQEMKEFIEQFDK